MNKATKAKIPVKKKAGSFVIETHVVQARFFGAGVKACDADSCDQAVRPKCLIGVDEAEVEQTEEGTEKMEENQREMSLSMGM